MDSSDGKVGENIDLPPEGPINIRQILEEQLLEVDNYFVGGSQKSYVLSSGRWNTLVTLWYSIFKSNHVIIRMLMIKSGHAIYL